VSVPSVIPDTEFRQRQAATRAATRQAGFDALLACARGGGSVDRYGNVMYLTNFYSSFPFIPDRSPDWSARAHPFVLVPAEGPSLLLADMPVNRDDVHADDVIVADDVVPALVKALRERLPGRRHIGVAGADAVPWSVFKRVEAAAPDISWVPADDILIDLRMIKSPAEIAVLRQASALGSRAIEAMMEAARPGATHGQIMGVGLDLLAREGAILYNNFMSSGRGGNAPSMVYSDFPTWASTEPLADGQWFQIGISGIWRGYYFDHSRSKPIGKSTAPEIESFEAAVACVQAGIAAIKPGATAGQVARAGFQRLADLGFSTKSDFSGLGHGIGLGWDSPWLVPDDATVLQPGMVLCVERTVERHGFVGDFEETVLVTATGSELLSTARIRNW
jgi:Xaa-Pro aminopeptidase